MSICFALSVSSIGTNELQLLRLALRHRKTNTFSFLYRNERTATCCKNRVITPRFSPFSFLYRNERTATYDIYPLRPSYRGFQFPLSERTNCNRQTHFERNTIQRLSVSSIGTNELQRAKFSPSRMLDSIFQFPLSERTNCNWTFCRRVKMTVRSFSFLYRNERTATLSK